MLRKTLSVVLVSATTMVLTTIFQPLSLVQSSARSQPHHQMQRYDTQTCQSFSQTGFQVCGRFLVYWYKYGSLKEFGYPVSTAFEETSDVNGERHVVQYFERAVFELHPNNKPPYDVLLSQLGREKYQRKYPFGTSSPVTIADPQADLNVSKQLRPGVSVKLIRQEQAAITGLYTGNCELAMTWVLHVENKSNSPFVATLDTSTIRMLDSTGKNYTPTRLCQGVAIAPYSGSFSGPRRLMPGESFRGTIAFQVIDIPMSASYFQLKVEFSNAPIEFKYMLP